MPIPVGLLVSPLFRREPDAASSPEESAQAFDVVILSGRIVDGTEMLGFPATSVSRTTRLPPYATGLAANAEPELRIDATDMVVSLGS
ncbi:MAG: hypothetical protein Ct9H300mP15_19430 [Gemmatimonadota bacterium]|nr:MAG: hypothetical protein Ct9H300mP15_19430 [Gemmatimonadota bacterium]